MGIQNQSWISIFMFILYTNTFVEAASANFSYESFDGVADRNFLKFEGSSLIYNGALQLTPETTNKALLHVHYNKSGRITYPEPFKLWSSSSSSSSLASFNTSFVINIYRESEWDAGHGLAFVIAPNYSSLPQASFGQWLGLTNATTDNNPENHIVAVEFDTQSQENDEIHGDHVGLNINSVKSKTAISLSKYNITLSPPPPGANYSVWIDYNGGKKLMDVYMIREGFPKPKEPILSEEIDLKQYLKQESYFGFAASTGDPEIELNCVLKWTFEIENIEEEEQNKKKLWLKIGLGTGIPIIVITMIIVSLIGRKRKLRKGASSDVERNDFNEENFGKKLMKWLPGMPREFKYKELKKATEDFNEKMKLGEGGFGIVYKGVLADGIEIAVKKFSGDNIKSKDDFLAELTIIHRLRHKHLVRLVGWCYEKRKLLLVYEFMPNGSLEKHLYEAAEQDTLSWSRRCKVLEGVASALHYLHNEYDQKVIHRDLKASNILLDKDFNGRLGDFGLARALENERNSYAELGLGGVPGTMGYVAPECFHTGRATPESDVFGFGAVVLEVVCGKGPGSKIHHNQHLYSLVDWVWMLHREGRIQEAVDERLKNDFVEDEAERLLLLGLACSHPNENGRPKTQFILQIISGALPAPHVPPFKPVFMWPSTDTSNSNSSLSVITLSSQASGRTKSLNTLQRTSSHPPV